MKLSIIAPIFNESENIPFFYKRLVHSLKKDFSKFKYEIIFVDDGSTDNSFELLKKLNKEDENVKLIKFDRNYGQQNAIASGLKSIQGDYIVIMDSDLQNRPEEIINLYKKLKKGYNIVYSIRDSYVASLFKKISSQAFWIVLKFVTLKNIPSNQSMLKIFDKKILTEVNKITDKNPFFPVLFYNAGLKQTTQIVKNDNRYKGKTKYNFKKMLKLTINAFSYNPILYIFKKKRKPIYKIEKRIS